MTANPTLAYADLTPDEMMAAIDDLGFRCNGRFLALNSYENRVYRFGMDDDADIIAKFYRPARWSSEQILEEHNFCFELVEHEVPVVPPMLIDGESLFELGIFKFALYENRGGRAPELDDSGQLEQLGRFVARIHNVGEAGSFTHRPVLDPESYGDKSRDFLLETAFIPEALRDVYADLSAEILDAVEHCIDRAGAFAEFRIHADFHPGNVLVAGDSFHIVDLDDTRTGPAVQDLWMFLSGDRTEQQPQLDALLTGYDEFRHFDARELHLVEALRSLRIMHYAAWLARRWEDPAFKIAFPWFESHRYWEEHVLSLREQLATMQEPPLFCGSN